MKLHHHRVWLAALVGAAAWLPNHSAVANITGFSGFAADNTRNSPTFPTTGYSADGTSFIVTDANPNEATSGYNPTPQGIAGFMASFNYQSVPGTTTANGTIAADGITLVFQNPTTGSTTALGGGGGSLGYGAGDNGSGTAVPAIPGATAALEFDVFGGAYSYAGGTGFQTNGGLVSSGGTGANAENKYAGTGIDFSKGNPIRIALTYNGATLTQVTTDTITNATVTFSYAANLQFILGSTTALVGFSGATGGYNATQTISNFTFTTVPEPGTWVTVLGGAGLLGLTIRRRAR